MSNIHNIIKQKMAENGITAEELARRCELSSMSIGRIINNPKYNPTITTLEKICKGLNVNIKSLVNHEAEDVVLGFLEYKGKIHKITSIEDVFNFCKNITLNSLTSPSKENKSGYCYIGTYENEEKPFKIGCTTNLKKRRKTLSYEYQKEVIFRYVVKCEDCKSLEREIHSYLKNERIINEGNQITEWFDLTNEKLKEIIKKYNFIDYE